MFETQYNDEMEAEIRRLDAKQRAINACHPEWDNACLKCGCRLYDVRDVTCESCVILIDGETS